MRLPRRHAGRHAGPRAPVGRPRRTMRGQLGRAGVRTMARTLVAAVILVGLVNLAPTPELPSGPAGGQSPTPAQLELMKRYDCAPDGFSDGRTPRSAIIRSQRGLEVVSFDRGWQVYTSTGPHALVAVCLDPPR